MGGHYSDDYADEANRHYAIKTIKRYSTKAERTIVNYNHLITLLQKGYTTVEVAFDKERQRRVYTYKASLTMGLQPADLAVVESPSGFEVVTVVRVHGEPQINVKAPYKFKWVVSKVDRTAYDEQMAREKKALALLQACEGKKAQTDALETLLVSVTNREELLRLLGHD